MYHDQHQLPCLHCQAPDHIRMVQHLIERCLIFHMSRDECIKALAKHANVDPIVTITVWKQLIKENSGFFEAYYHAISSRSRHDFITIDLLSGYGDSEEESSSCT
ncbi:uncharacterized protein LOC119999473 [Tripterygium wilfordii]|uniref:uncharacterized protein LOC119999473 n=1 Tax=Tripterygium wilfordii TaxID=458696 RepID=UPI0018F7E802|nr:uncharacterized protein LOC119999473 [Tripterygium wilfordii]